jgi:hypothetical protein
VGRWTHRIDLANRRVFKRLSINGGTIGLSTREALVDATGHANDALYHAVRNYLPLAISLIVQKATAHVDISELTEEHFFFASLEADDDLSALAEYRACKDTLEADTKISSQLDTLLGDNSRRERTQTVLWLMRRMPHMGLARGKYEFDEDYFEREYRIFEKAFYDDYIIYDVIAPLQGLLITGNVSLTEDLNISSLTNDDLDPLRKSRSTVIRDNQGIDGVPCAIRSKFRVRKVIGNEASIDLEEADKDRKRFTRTAEQIDEVVNALRLFGGETVYYSAIIYRTSGWLFRDEKVFSTRMRVPLPLIFPRDQAWLHSFAEFWRKLQSPKVRNRKFIAVAVRRFGYAIERPFTEDRLVDLMIAAESLFLNDIGDKKYQGELQYRLSLRAACLLGGDASGRSVVRGHMRQAYNIRSAVVHGSAKTFQPKNEEGNPIRLEEFLGIIQMYVHRTIRLMIDQAARVEPKQPLFDWEKAMLSGPDLTASDNTAVEEDL